MLKDYTCLMCQAEEIEIDKHELVYNKAFNMLNENKGNRMSQLVSDLEEVINLIILELDKYGKINDENLIRGIHYSFQHVIIKYQLLIDVLNFKDCKQAKKEMESLVQKLKEDFKKYYNYEQ